MRTADWVLTPEGARATNPRLVAYHLRKDTDVSFTINLDETSLERLCRCGHPESRHDAEFVPPRSSLWQRFEAWLAPHPMPCTDRSQELDGVVQPCSCNLFVESTRVPR